LATPESPRIYEFGEFRLDTGRQALFNVSTGEWIPLTPRVFDTLYVLVEHSGRLIAKAELMEAVWPDTVVEENNLDQNISTLRRLLGERRDDPRYIQTVRGRGYRFAAPVTVLEALADEPVVAAPATPPAAAPALSLRRLIIGAGALSIVGGWVLLLGWRDAAPTATAIDHPPALAVLPFRALGTGNRNESLELGIAETLIRQLNTPQLSVRPLSAVRRFADPEQDAVLAGRALSVESVLEGHLQLDADRLRVSVRLLRVEDGAQLWSERFDQDFSDIFAVQDTIAARVRASLAIGSPREMPSVSRHPTEDPIAYQHYVNGRFFRQQGNEASLRRALQHFQQAIERDPEFALAYVGLSESHAVLGVFGAVAPHEAFPPAQAAVERALEIAGDLGEAYAALGHIRTQYEHDWMGADQALRHAIELSPSHAPAHQWLGLLLALLGRFDEAMTSMHRAQALDTSPMYSAMVGKLLNYQRRYDESIELLQGTLDMAPDLPTAHTYLAFAYLRRGDFESAREHLDRAPSRTPGSASYPGQILALSGRRDEALAEIERLIEESHQQYVAAYDVATIYAALGDADKTMAWLDRAVDDRSQLIGWLRWDPVFDSIRHDPRYAALVARLGFPS
jgi:DNA-binding winged helix-turn-helix (wHTH) protein/TolB-like protein/tetratricopeptide (TPR) repeat protein